MPCTGGFPWACHAPGQAGKADPWTRSKWPAHKRLSALKVNASFHQRTGIWTQSDGYPHDKSAWSGQRGDDDRVLFQLLLRIPNKLQGRRELSKRCFEALEHRGACPREVQAARPGCACQAHCAHSPSAASTDRWVVGTVSHSKRRAVRYWGRPGSPGPQAPLDSGLVCPRTVGRSAPPLCCVLRQAELSLLFQHFFPSQRLRPLR